MPSNIKTSIAQIRQSQDPEVLFDMEIINTLKNKDAAQVMLGLVTSHAGAIEAKNAMEKNDIIRAEKLLNLIALDTNMVVDGKPFIYYAIKAKSLLLVRLLKDKGVSIHGQALRQYAYQCDALDIYKYLVQQDKADLTYDYGIIRDAIWDKKPVEFIQWLINSGADIEQKQFSFPPLSMAITTGFIDGLKVLVDHGANVYRQIKNSRIASYSLPLFLLAHKAGQPEMAEYMLQHGVNKGLYPQVLSDSIVEQLPLHLISRLIEQGAEINLPIDNPPLYWAIDNNSLELGKLLVDKGARIFLETKNNKIARDRLPLLFLAHKANQHELVEYMVKHGKTDDFYPYLVSDTIMRNLPLDLIAVLLERGAQINSERDKESPLYWALQNDNFELVKLLVDKGADVNKIVTNNLTQKEPATLLEIAYLYRPSMLNYLLEYGKLNLEGANLLERAVVDKKSLAFIQSIVTKGAKATKKIIEIATDPEVKEFLKQQFHKQQ